MTYDPTSLEGVPEHGRERLAQNEARPLHQRPLGQRVPAREGGGLRAARARRRDARSTTSASRSSVEPEPGDGRPHPGDVPRPRARDDAHGGGGRPARRRRDRRRAARRQPLRVGRRPRRVHRDRHRRPPPRGRAAPRAERPARSRATSRARTSTRCSPPATGRSGMVHGDAASTTSPTRACAAGCAGRPQRRDAELHPGALRRARAGDGAHAGRGRGARGRGRSSASSCTEGNHGWSSHVIEYFSVGTAVVPDEGRAHDRPADAHAQPRRLMPRLSRSA